MHDPHDWLTQRQMAERLHEELGIHPETARRLLVAGLLDGARATSLAVFYPRDALDTFVARHHAQGPTPTPDRNLVVVRVGHGRVRLGAQTQDHLDRLGEGWRMSGVWRALFSAVAERGDRGGLLATLGGFVVAGADIVGAEWVGQEGLPPGDPDGSYLLTRFDLVEAGSWYDDWRGRYLPTGRGGAALRVWPLGGRLRKEPRPRMRT